MGFTVSCTGFTVIFHPCNEPSVAVPGSEAEDAGNRFGGELGSHCLLGNRGISDALYGRFGPHALTFTGAVA
jgi:hypothetical protein